MKPPDDRVLLLDMVDYAPKAIAASSGCTRADLDRDEVLAAALERFVEVVGEAVSKVSETTRASIPAVPWRIEARPACREPVSASDHAQRSPAHARPGA